jgi:hypothetical protein
MGTFTHSHLCSLPLGPKKLLILNVNVELCYSPCSTILQGNARVFRRNVDKTKWKLELDWNFFCYNISKVLRHNLVLYELEDVLEVLPMLMP